MRAYLDIVRNVLKNGKEKGDRTGTGTISLFGVKFEHNMAEGFPLLTTKKMASKTMRVELEGFINGVTDKKWFQDRGCKIWNEWCRPDIVPYSFDFETREAMKEERDLGPIYGWQWRHFGAKYGHESDKDESPSSSPGYAVDYSGRGVDQLANMVKDLKENQDSRRILVTALNPADQKMMALPPCHYSFQAEVTEGKLNLSWNQRSVDSMLGLPFNISSYAMLLHLLAKEAGLKEGKLVGNLGDTHIYQNHIGGAQEQLKREPRSLPKVKTDNFTSIFDWKHDDTKFEDYNPHPAMSRDRWFPIAV